MSVENKIIHFHLFKNAGTTIEFLFNKKLKGKWIDIHPLMIDPKLGNRNRVISRADFLNLIGSLPNYQYFSSHNIFYFEEEGYLSLIPLRDPISRILSVYHFEIKQGKKGVSFPGPRNAINLDPKDYFRWRLESRQNNVVANFQSLRILGEAYRNIELGYSEETKIENLISKFKTPFYVSEFTKSMQILCSNLSIPFSNSFDIQKNSSGNFNNEGQAIKYLEDLIGKDLSMEVVRRNWADIQLIKILKDSLQRNFSS